MPIGKDSITKRVAKSATEEKNIAPELVATSAAAPKKAPAKKASSPAKKPATKKPATAAKKSAAPKKETVKTAAPLVDSTVLANVSPETVAAVIGHKENSGFEKVQLGEKLPVHLL